MGMVHVFQGWMKRGGICFFCAVCALYVLTARGAFADVSTLQKLRFGELIVTNNNAALSVVVNPDGSFSASSGLIVITDPHPGLYNIDDLVPNSLITVSASQLQPLTGGANFFTLRDFHVVHTNSNAIGMTSIMLGATAETSGNGQPYGSRIYNGAIQIQISY